MEYLSLILQNSKFPESILYERHYFTVAGVDEAGRGPLAGPVVASAVVLKQGWKYQGIKDSKKLTERKRDLLYPIISEGALAWAWASVEASEIDKINILQATLKAMRHAVENLPIRPDYLIVDGIFPVPTSIPQTSIKKGDQKSITIAAASIMAKVIRDSIMKRYHYLYPHYNFVKNKGYGTKEHLQALLQYGPCPIHRKTFKGVPSSMREKSI